MVGPLACKGDEWELSSCSVHILKCLTVVAPETTWVGPRYRIGALDGEAGSWAGCKLAGCGYKKIFGIGV